MPRRNTFDVRLDEYGDSAWARDFVHCVTVSLAENCDRLVVAIEYSASEPVTISRNVR